MEKLQRCDLNCNIFSVYDYDGLSMQELLCEFFTKINECVDSTNTTLDLVKWLTNEGLKIEVANNLVNWLNNGVFDEILDESLLRSLNLFKTVINVKEFGVVGDGIVDDTENIQKALDSAAKGSIIYFPQGEYLISESLNINKECLTIKGDDNFNSFVSTIKTNTRNINIFNVLKYGCIFKGLTFIGDLDITKGYTNGTTKGIYFNIDEYAGNDAYIDKCSFLQVDIGVLIKNRNVRIENCLFGELREGIKIINSESSDGYGGAVRGIQIKNNIFHGVGNTYSSNKNEDVSCITVDVCKLSQDIIITGNKIEAWTSRFFKGYINGVVLTNNIANNVVGGFKFIDIISSDINKRGFSISNNVFNGDYNKTVEESNHNFIYCEGDLLHGEIKDNLVNKSGKSCIHIKGNVDNVIIENNNLISGYLEHKHPCLTINGYIKNSSISNNILECIGSPSGAILIDSFTHNDTSKFDNNIIRHSVQLMVYANSNYHVTTLDSYKAIPSNSKTEILRIDFSVPFKNEYLIEFGSLFADTSGEENEVAFIVEVNNKKVSLCTFDKITPHFISYKTDSKQFTLNTGLNIIKLYCMAKKTLNVTEGYNFIGERINNTYLSIKPLDKNKFI